MADKQPQRTEAKASQGLLIVEGAFEDQVCLRSLKSKKVREINLTFCNRLQNWLHVSNE